MSVFVDTMTYCASYLGRQIHHPSRLDLYFLICKFIQLYHVRKGLQLMMCTRRIKNQAKIKTKDDKKQMNSRDVNSVKKKKQTNKRWSMFSVHCDGNDEIDR